MSTKSSVRSMSHLRLWVRSGCRSAFNTPPTRYWANFLTVEIVEQPPGGPDEGRAQDLGGAHPVEDEGPPVGELQGLGKQLAVEMDLYALVPESLGEGVVLLLGLLRPHHVVEQQLADVLGGEAGQFEPGSVDDGLAQLADF